jgi:hypothetical protein
VRGEHVDAQSVDHRDDPVEPEGAHPASGDRADDAGGRRRTGRLDEDPRRPPGCEIIERAHEVLLRRAADAPAGDLDELPRPRREELAVDSRGADLVHDHRHVAARDVRGRRGAPHRLSEGRLG